MRIVLTGPFFFPQLDGVEKVMLSHARLLAAGGHEVHVVTSGLRYPSGAFPDAPAEERMEGFTIHRLRVALARPNWRFDYLNNGGVIVPGLVRKLAALAPEVLHAHQIAAPAWAHAAAWYAATRRRRFFYSPHWHPDWKPGLRRNLLLHGLNRLPLTIARRVFHQTRTDFDPFLEEYPWVPRARLDVLPHGAADPLPGLARPPRAPGEFVALFVGRVDEPRKGFDILRAAFARARRPGWRLEVVGRVGDETRASLVAEFGDAVRVHGLVAETALERAYAEADVFAMPSRYEGFGIPFIEAMRYGTPVIGTAIGGVPEVVPEGTGILVPLEGVAEVAAALTHLADDPAARTRMGEAGRRWAEGFRWEAIVARLEREYAEGRSLIG